MAHRRRLDSGVLCIVRIHQQLWLFPGLLPAALSFALSALDRGLHWDAPDHIAVRDRSSGGRSVRCLWLEGLP